jgi:hypothetical protein
MKDVENAARDFIGIFNQLAVPYALMGGLAVRAFGVPRPTYDVDVTLALGEEQLPALYDAAEIAGYTVPEAYRKGCVDQMGGMPVVKFRIYASESQRSVDVDLFLAHTKYQSTIIERRIQADVMGLGTAWVVTPEDIILLKLVAGRPRDLGDIEDVRFMCGELDGNYMRTWATKLGVEAELEKLLERPPL